MKFIVLVLALMLFAKNAPQAGFQEVIQTSSGPTCYYPIAILSLVFTIIEFGVEVIVPYPVYVMCSTLVAFQVSRSLRRRFHLVHNVERSFSGRKEAESAEKVIMKEESSTGTVRLLLINNVSFVLLYSPYNVFRVFQVRASK